MTAFIASGVLRLTITGSVSVNASPEINLPSFANAFTLAGPTTGVTGTANTYTVTPNGNLEFVTVVTPAASNGGSVNPASLSFAAGSNALQQFTVTRSADGASSVSITNNRGLTNSGSPITLTTTSNTALTDFLTRSSGAAVAENFNYPDLLTFYNTYNVGLMVGRFANKTPAMGTTFSPNALELITTAGHVLSGKALRLWYGKNNYGGAVLNNDYQTVCLPFNNGNSIAGQWPTGAYMTKAYVQICFWTDAFIDYYWRLQDGSTGGSKFFIIDDYDKTSSTGELVVTDGNNQQFLRAYRIMPTGGSAGIERSRATPGNNNNIQRQNGIDNTSVTVTDENSAQRRYGPMYTGMTGGTSQASRLSTQGVPDPDSAVGGVAITRAGIHVVEVEVDLTGDRCRVWQAPHGSPPKLTHDTRLENSAGTGSFNVGSRVGSLGTGWSGVSLTNLIHTAIAATNPNYPTDAYTDYSEVIVKNTPINFPGGHGLPGFSALATLAASMSSGSWADFTMGNLNAALVFSGDSQGVRSIIAYTSKGVWDPVHKKIQFWGIGHGDQSTPLVFPYLITYDDATNTWSKASAPPPTGGGHAYSQMTVNPANGDLYKRQYNSNTVDYKPYGGAWTTIASKLPGNNQISGSLEWFPELNSGVGGLIFTDQGGMQKWNPTTNTWAYIGTGFSPILGNYGQVGAYAGGFVYGGGGTGGPNGSPPLVYRVSSAGTSYTAIANTPHGIAVSAESPALVAHPNGSGNLILFESPSPGSANRIHMFNGTSWTQTGTHQIGKDNYFCAAIPEYGIVVFICQNNNNGHGNPNCRVYKP